MPTPPWPAQGNPKLGYLIDRAKGLLEEGDPEAAIVWLAAPAWSEGAVEERFNLVRRALGLE